MTLLMDNKVEEDSTISQSDVNKMRESVKQELLALTRQKEDLYKKRKLWYWIPNPKQLTFFEHSFIKRRAGFCGNRFGKSTLGVVEDCCWLIGFRPFFPVGHPLRTLGIPRHGVKGLVIAEDWDKVKEIFTNEDSEDRLGKFIEFLPEDYIKKKHRNEKGIVDQITVSSKIDSVIRESVLYFDTVKSFKQNPRSFESSDWDFIHADEPLPKELWVAVTRGLIDRGGFTWQLLTPLSEIWMYNEQLENTRTTPHLYWWFEATMDDNPTLKDEDKEIYLNQLPEDQRNARRKGIPLAYGRLVFGDFDPDVHLFEGNHPTWPRISRPPEKDSMVVYAIDTHPQTPHAALFAAVDKNGDIDIYDEIWEKCRIQELAKSVRLKIDGLRIQYGLCEPAAWNEDQGSGFCYADMFYAEQLDLIPGSKRKEDAIILTQQLFKQRKRVVRIHARCKRLRWELINNYFTKDNVPEDKNDHMLECLRRLVIHDNLTYYPASYSDGKSVTVTTERELQVSGSHSDLTLGNEKLQLTNI